MISIITTFFNPGELILQNLTSIHSIGVSNKEKVEHILISDGSSAESIDLVKKNLKPNQKLIESEKIGRGSALNLGIEHASFDVISILDADDIINPDWIEMFIDFLESSDEKFINKSIFFGKVVFIGETFQDFTFPQNKIYKDCKRLNSISINFLNPIPHLGVMMSKRAIRDVGFYSSGLKSQLDWDLWFKLDNLNCKFYRFDFYSGAKRIHRNQSFESKNHFRYALSGSILQMKWTLYRKPHYFIFVLLFSFLRLAWAILPANVRIIIRSFFTR